MSTVEQLQTWVAQAKQLLESDQSDTDIQKVLKQRGIEEDALVVVIKQVHVIRMQKRRNRGLNFIIAGAMVLVVGFILTVFFFHGGTNFNWIMYGGTTLGLVLIFIGLVDCLGW